METFLKNVLSSGPLLVLFLNIIPVTHTHPKSPVRDPPQLGFILNSGQIADEEANRVGNGRSEEVEDTRISQPFHGKDPGSIRRWTTQGDVRLKIHGIRQQSLVGGKVDRQEVREGNADTDTVYP